MPIDARVLDEIDDLPRIRPGTNKWEVLELLLGNPDTAFTRSDILEQTGVGENSVGPVLVRLKESELVENNRGYWMARSNDRVQALHDSLLSLRASARHSEVDDFSDWKRQPSDE